MMLSNCCFKPAGVYVPPVSMSADSPPDSVEYCTECDQKCEPIDHDCPAEFVRLPLPLHEKLEQIATQEYWTISDVIREAIKFYLKSREVQDEKD